MFVKPQPKIMSLVCTLRGRHSPVPLRYLEWFEGAPNNEGEFRMIEDPVADRCEVCGLIDYQPGSTPDREMVHAGVRSLRGGGSVREGGLGESKHVGYWGIRIENYDSPSIDRLDYEIRQPTMYRRPAPQGGAWGARILVSVAMVVGLLYLLSTTSPSLLP